MLWKMYAVFDSAAAVYDRPFVAHNHGSAARSFGDIAVSADHPIGKHPEHYSLVYIGEYDDGKGELRPVDRITVCTGLEMVAEAQKVDAGKIVELEKKVQEVN